MQRNEPKFPYVCRHKENLARRRKFFFCSPMLLTGSRPWNLPHRTLTIEPGAESPMPQVSAGEGASRVALQTGENDAQRDENPAKNARKTFPSSVIRKRHSGVFFIPQRDRPKRRQKMKKTARRLFHSSEGRAKKTSKHKN